MINTLGKFGLLLFGVCLLSAAPVFADSTNFAFPATLGVLGPSETFTSGSLSLVASGFSGAGGTPADLFGKNLGGVESGLGLAFSSDHEIQGMAFIQLDLANILAASPSSVALSFNSVLDGDRYAIWGSNTAGSMGTLLATNQTALSFTVPDLGMFRYISISAPAGAVLLHDVDVSTPEPSSASMLLLGLVTLLGAGTLGKKLVS